MPNPKDLPSYNYSHAAIQRKQRSKANRRAKQPLFFDSAMAGNQNYMNIIKESHESILRRKDLAQEKHRILNMDFKKRDNRKDWENLNKFLEEKQQTNEAVDIVLSKDQ